MNKALKNMFFSVLKNKFESIAKDSMKEKHKKELKTNKEAKLFDCGKVLELSYLVTKEKTMQVIKYENFTAKSYLTVEEKLKFAGMVGVDIQKEESSKNEKGSEVEDIFYIANFDKKIINIFTNYKDKTTKKITL